MWFLTCCSKTHFVFISIKMKKSCLSASSKSINVSHTACLNFMLSWFPVITQRLMCLSLFFFFKFFITFLISLLRYFCLKNCLLWSQSCWTVIYCYCTYFVSNGLFVGQVCVALMISWRGKLSQDCVFQGGVHRKKPHSVTDGIMHVLQCSLYLQSVLPTSCNSLQSLQQIMTTTINGIEITVQFLSIAVVVCNMYIKDFSHRRIWMLLDKQWIWLRSYSL